MKYHVIMVRYTALLIGFILLSGQLMAQALSTQNKAALKYYKAAQMSTNQSDKQHNLKKAIAKDKKFTEAYWALANVDTSYDEQIAILSNVSASMPRYVETQFKIAEIYYHQGEIDKAIALLLKIRDSKPEMSSYINPLLDKYQKVKALYQNPVSFEPKNLTAVSTDLDDYFPSITADGRIICTTVSDQNDRTSQEDLYWSVYRDGEWQLAIPVNDINTSGNEGSQSFSTDGRYMFFVACHQSYGTGCDIYYSIRTGDRWSRPINPGAPLNSEMWESNPYLSPAGNELYFVSNRHPNVGGRDIWKCDVTIQENGSLKFSNPINVGTPINTKGDEFAPFVHADNRTLYFSSNGHTGLGGYDIFYARRQDVNKQWGTPVNIGYPINSPSDEYGLVLNASGDKAYISSGRFDKDNGRGLDIYEFDLYSQARPNPMSLIIGQVIDAKTKKQLDASVEIFDTNTSEVIYQSHSDYKTGEFTGLVPAKGQYGINVRRKGYLFYSDNINSTNEFLLVELTPLGAGQSIILNNLFFAFNSAVIEPTSNKELALLTEFMKNNSQVKVEIIGHTDSIGSNSYNLNLSTQRAESVRQALIDRGISADRITAKGMGSTQPIESNQTEEGRLRNRRVECVIH